MTTESQQDARKARGWRRRCLRSFVKNRDGATVVEFALLALPFSMVIFAILESCISFAAEEHMQNVTDNFARQFRTGQIRQNTYTQAQFREEFCEKLQTFVGPNCPGLDIDLRTFTNFVDAAALRTQVNTDREIALTGGFRYEPGRSQSINVLRVFYRWPVLTNVLRKQMSTLNGGRTLHFSQATWQNEPFDDL